MCETLFTDLGGSFWNFTDVLVMMYMWCKYNPKIFHCFRKLNLVIFSGGITIKVNR